MNWKRVGLGKVSDRVLAARLGVSHTAVRRARLRLGIKPAHKPPKRKQWSRRGLGRMPDAEIARREGVTRQTVHRERERRGIKAYGG
ncbi:MAG TPA: hypothetical protein VF331_06885 [Polyangiales bacterium]